MIVNKNQVVRIAHVIPWCSFSTQAHCPSSLATEHNRHSSESVPGNHKYVPGQQRARCDKAVCLNKYNLATHNAKSTSTSAGGHDTGNAEIDHLLAHIGSRFEEADKDIVQEEEVKDTPMKRWLQCQDDVTFDRLHGEGR
jgi:hypothetical protein